jgi:hypothetical protein
MKTFFTGVVCLFAGACLGAGSGGNQEYSYHTVRTYAGIDGKDRQIHWSDFGRYEFLAADIVMEGETPHWQILYRVKK